jgi:hypothetical protein
VTDDSYPVSVRIYPEELSQITKEARRLRLNRSGVIRVALTHYFSAKVVRIPRGSTIETGESTRVEYAEDFE